MSLGTLEMARPKKAKPQLPESASAEDRMTIINLKGSLAYSEWLESAHKKTRLSKATIFRLGIELAAKQLGLPDPPEI